MRWVLIRPLNISPYYDPEIQEPLGLEYLATLLFWKEEFILILDSALNNLNDIQMARRAISFSPDIIGFSLTTAQEVASVKAVYEECKKIKYNKNIIWIAGGNFITTETELAQKILPDEFILVKYEGEIALDEISNLLNNSNINDKKFKKPPLKKIIIGKPVEKLDSLHFPIRNYPFRILDSGLAFNMMGSRGCCGSCHYCSSPGMAETGGRKWRGRSPENIVNEMVHLYQYYGIQSFNFIDEDFLGPSYKSLNRANNFSKEIQKRHIPFSFGIQVRPYSLNQEIIELLAKAGLRYVFMGIESIDPVDFKRWNRRYSRNPWKWIPILRRYGIEINVGTLLFHSHSTFQSIRRFASRLHQYQLLEYRSATNRLDAMPGSYFYKMAIKKGEIDPNIPGPQPLKFIHPEIEIFYNDILKVLSPLGPPSMHAICALPSLYTRPMDKDETNKKYKELKQIICFLDDAVSKSFFCVLDIYEKGKIDNDFILMLRKHNLEIAVRSIEMLCSGGFANSFEALRRAVSLDSGL